MAYPPSTGTVRVDHVDSATAADVNVQKAALDDIVTELGPNPSGTAATVQARLDTVDAGKSPRTDEYLVDDFAGASDDAKLTAALTYAAAQTYPPTIVFANRATTYTYTTRARTMFTGLHLKGPGGMAFQGADDGTTGARGFTINLNFTSTGDQVGWFNDTNTNSSAKTRNVCFENLVIRGGQNAIFISRDAAGASVQCMNIHNLTTSGLWGTIGSKARSFTMTICTFTGNWNINNNVNTSFNVGGSDNAFCWTRCNLDSPAANHPGVANTYHMELASLAKTPIYGLYATCTGNWGGIHATGSAYNNGGNVDGPNVFDGAVVEGHNGGDPCFGRLVLISGGIYIFRDTFFGYAMSASGTAGSSGGSGIVVCTGGRTQLQSCTYGRATGVAETVPFVWASGNSTRAIVKNTMVGSQNSQTWSGLPRTQATASSVIDGDAYVTAI